MVGILKRIDCKTVVILRGIFIRIKQVISLLTILLFILISMQVTL